MYSPTCMSSESGDGSPQKNRHHYVPPMGRQPLFARRSVVMQ
jgi:hypothetical protein